MSCKNILEDFDVKFRGYEFSLRELAGSMGDFGTLLPLVIGYIVIVGMDPACMLIMFGLSNIVLGIVYNLPMPLQPKKVVAAIAIADRWHPGLVQGTGIALGVTWLILAFTGLVDKLVKITPKAVIRGIQLALGITLAWSGIQMIYESEILLGLAAILILLLLGKNEKAPASLILMGLGIFIMFINNNMKDIIQISLSLPYLQIPSFQNIYEGFALAGIAQMPLTLSNAVIATAALLREYFPELAEKKVSEKKLMLNMGFMNLIVPLFGGMPQCHGAGGLAGQYYFGARTGGSAIMEGIIELGLGLFLAQSIKNLFAIFPMSIVGAMMLFVGIELGKLTKSVDREGFAVVILTTLLAVIFNMAVGYVVGMIFYYLVEKKRENKNK
jgi:MFS superfamily sulfate permease-like transporter